MLVWKRSKVLGFGVKKKKNQKKEKKLKKTKKKTVFFDYKLIKNRDN